MLSTRQHLSCNCLQDLELTSARRLECQSRKSRDTWSNRQVWFWSTKWSRTKANRALPRETQVNYSMEKKRTNKQTWMDLSWKLKARTGRECAWHDRREIEYVYWNYGSDLWESLAKAMYSRCFKHACYSYIFHDSEHIGNSKIPKPQLSICFWSCVIHLP